VHLLDPIAERVHHHSQHIGLRTLTVLPVPVTSTYSRGFS
jgi:hypothetical protein